MAIIFSKAEVESEEAKKLEIIRQFEKMKIMPAHLCTEQRICIALLVGFKIPYYESQYTYKSIIQKEKACKTRNLLT